MFSVSITHNSKIRELSDGNRVIETELSFAKQPFCYGSHHFWVMSYENWELSYGKPNTPLTTPLDFSDASFYYKKQTHLYNNKIDPQPQTQRNNLLSFCNNPTTLNFAEEIIWYSKRQPTKWLLCSCVCILTHPSSL